MYPSSLPVPNGVGHNEKAGNEVHADDERANHRYAVGFLSIQ